MEDADYIFYSFAPVNWGFLNKIHMLMKLNNL